MTRSAKLRGVLLDVDGTLIDSNDAHARAWSDALREFGYDIPADHVRALVGKGGDKVLPELTGLDAESDAGKEITERRARIFDAKYLPELRTFPRVHELLTRFRRDNLRLLIATSSDAGQLDRMLGKVGLDELVERKTSSSDADRSKPDPDIIRAALRKGDLRPHETVMLGDTPYDIEAAERANVKAVIFRSGGWSDDALVGALAIFDDASDLLRNYDHSPFSA